MSQATRARPRRTVLRTTLRLLAAMAIFYAAGVGNGERIVCELEKLLDSLSKTAIVLGMIVWAILIIFMIT